MSTQTEWAVFRQANTEDQTPMENLKFWTRERVEKSIEQFIDGHSWLEVRSREVTPWEAPHES
jgi:hypothetical protein